MITSQKGFIRNEFLYIKCWDWTFYNMMRHSFTEWLDTTTHFYFKYLESRDTTLGLDIFQGYVSPEPHFIRHQAFPSPDNSPSTLDSFSTSKQGSVLMCNILFAKTSARQECTKGQVQVETCDSVQEAGTVSPQASEARSTEAGRGGRPIKRTWLLQGLFQTGEWEILAINS